MQKVVASEKEVKCPKCGTRFEITPEFWGAEVECPDCALPFEIVGPQVVPPPAPAAPPPPAPAAVDPGASIRQRQTQVSAANPAARSGQRPVTPPAPPASAASASRAVPVAAQPQQVTSSGIQISHEDTFKPTGTVRLSRDMSMYQKNKEKVFAPPPPPEAVAKMPEVHAIGKDVKCPKCSESFEITPDFYGAVAECPDCGAEFLIKAPVAPPPPAAEDKPKLKLNSQVGVMFALNPGTPPPADIVAKIAAEAAGLPPPAPAAPPAAPKPAAAKPSLPKPPAEKPPAAPAAAPAAPKPAEKPAGAKPSLPKPPVAAPAAKPTAEPAAPVAAAPAKGLSTGAIIALIVGALLVGGGIAFAIAWMWLKK